MSEMRSHQPDGPVVVAVDGTDDGARALRYGVGEALRRGGRLRLVHVPHETIPMAPMLPVFAAEALHEVAVRILRDAERHAQELGDGDLDVEGVLGHGPRVPALLEHLGDASVVVLGQRSSSLRRFVTGSTTLGVAGRAACPVVCVPGHWEPDRVHGRVVAGVDGSPASPRVLEAAFDAAARRTAKVTVLHAWRPAAEHGLEAVVPVLRQHWEASADPHVAELVAATAAAYSGVEADRLLAYERAVPALVEESRDADLVVVGRTGAGAPFGLSPGTVARALVREALCPVQIVPVSA